MERAEINRRISAGKKRGWAKYSPAERKARTMHLQVECTPQKRERMSAAAKRKWKDPNYRSSQLAALSKATSTPEHIALIRQLAQAGVFSHFGPMTEESKHKMSKVHIALDLKGERNAMSKPCRCQETGVVYACIRQAAELTGIPRSNISAVLNGHQNTAHGFHFVFAEKPEYVSVSKRRKRANSAAVPPTNKGGDTNGE